MNTEAMQHMSHTTHGGGGAFADFAAMWSPGLALIVIVAGWLYWMAVHRWRHQFAEAAPVRVGQQLYFYAGLLLFYIAEGSGLSYYGHHYSFSAHMLQQSISYLIMPPLILLGTPEWLVRPMFRTKPMHLVMKLATMPLIALFTFNMVFSFYHIPMIMDALMANALLHFIYNVIFMLAAFQMWFPIFGPLPEYNKMSELRKMGYIFVNGILLTPACALIIFAGKPLYASYANVEQSYLLMSLINDQQFGGVIMKIVQEIVYGIALAYVFFRWYRRERKEEDEEELASENYTPSQVQTNRI
jgi:putative membrane protein